MKEVQYKQIYETTQKSSQDEFKQSDAIDVTSSNKVRFAIKGSSNSYISLSDSIEMSSKQISYVLGADHNYYSTVFWNKQGQSEIEFQPHDEYAYQRKILAGQDTEQWFEIEWNIRDQEFVWEEVIELNLERNTGFFLYGWDPRDGNIENHNNLSG